MKTCTAFFLGLFGLRAALVAGTLPAPHAGVRSADDTGVDAAPFLLDAVFFDADIQDVGTEVALGGKEGKGEAEETGCTRMRQLLLDGC